MRFHLRRAAFFLLTLEYGPECILIWMRHSPNGIQSTIQIGEAALRTALSVDTIRFYERRALLPPVPRTTGRFRLYSTDDVTRLNFIRQMQGLGFSLQQIKQLLDLREHGGYACEEVRHLLGDKLIEVRGKIRDLQKLEIELAVDLRKCSRELKYTQSHVPRQCPILTASGGK
ncbi:MAG: heavy metal-responsive transcriptional regulator [Candidatus Sulfotelmatobacter sp.]